MGDSASRGSDDHSKHSEAFPGSRYSLTQAVSRLNSLRTQTSTNTSSKNTAFYSAQSHFADTAGTAESFHTAEDTQASEQRSMRWQRAEKLNEQAEDENLVHSMARQYVLDAEALGPRTPDRTRRSTDASRGLGGDITSDDMREPSRGREPDSRGRDVDSRERSVTPERALSERLRDEEVEDDANEAQHFLSARLRYPPPRYSVRADSRVPAGAVLFALGFLLLPLWWVGAVFPRSAQSDVVRTWRKYNALMTLLSLPLLGLFLALGGWHATHS
ncbi:hypothetical protein IWW36_001734 [Coemansia brasiliensis]|uniref:Uncharacterized protein n=1 Tax=Coemansia brasiliensis TaxID=2650707 RepID=A0A9W8I8G5_9FUNG|nr:hypothetical protein IWW36_001734 [Coemansia brasiliensis]